MALSSRAARKVTKSKVVKKAVKGAKDVVKSAKSTVKKIGKSKRVRAGAKEVGHALLGTTGIRAGAKLRQQLKSRKKK